MALHHNLTTTNVHTPYRQVFADETARLADATVYVAADLYKKAYQIDDSTEYVLTAITPTWTAVGGAGGGYGTQISDAPTGQQDDYAPTGWDDCSMLVISPTAALDITGFAKPTATDKPHRKTIVQGNVNATTIKHGDAGVNSLAVNQVRVPGGADHVQAALNDVTTIEYDDITDVWRLT